MIEAQHKPKTTAQRCAHQSLSSGCADRREARDRHGVCARARPRADQNVHAEILERGIEDLFDVRQQAVDLVDKEDLVGADVGEHAREVELLLKNRPGGLLEAGAELRSNNGCQRGLPQTRRAVQQHVIHCFAAMSGRLDRNRQVFFELRLTGEIRQALRAERCLKLPLTFERRRRNYALIAQLPIYRTSSSERRKRGSKSSPTPADFAFLTAPSAAARLHPRLMSADKTSCSTVLNGGAGRAAVALAVAAMPMLSSLSFSSRTMRSAVFLPTPGIRTSCSTWPVRIAVTRSAVLRPESRSEE